MRLKITLKVKLLFVLLAALVLFASVTVVWNTVRLEREIDDRTKRYVSDVSVQLAKDIDNRLSNNIVNLESISGSLLRADTSDLSKMEMFLRRKADEMGFNALLIANPAGAVFQYASPVEDLYSFPGIQASLNGEAGVSFLGEQSILYSIPIQRDGVVTGVLGGIRDKENMQKLIEPESFSGQSLTCIINHEGEVIISPKEIDTFLQLDSIFAKDPEGKVAQEIHQMEKNMSAHESGIFRFQSVSGSDLLLSYNPLHSYDWVLLTLVPSNVISIKIDGLMNQTFFIIIGVVLLMTVILAVLFWRQWSHYKQMSQAAFVDRVTGGMNNAAFQLKCEQELPLSPPGTYTIVLFNVKDFKFINERFGSEQGNEFLRKIMQTLDMNAKNIGFAARADADNFFLCLKLGTPDTVSAVIQKIMEDMHAYVRVFNKNCEIPYHFVLQCGAYIVEDPSLDITVIQDRAKTACRNRTDLEDGVLKFYDTKITERLTAERELSGLFESSLANHDFLLYLQPKMWAKDGTLGGAEALVRWIHPQKGVIFPSDFIPLFESNGMICRLDFYIFEEVCKTIRHRQDAGKPLFPISVNLSRQHFMRPGFLKPFADMAKQYRVPARMIEFEITESIFFDDQTIESVKAHIKEMHNLGFGCSLDDFGSGYSSLGLLMEFEVDAIKLDRRFFKDLNNKKVQDMITAIAALSKKMGALCVAEGIETKEQLLLVKDAGCDLVQGYFYAKPMPVSEFDAWQKKNGITTPGVDAHEI